jgi:hypothetical protein
VGLLLRLVITFEVIIFEELPFSTIAYFGIFGDDDAIGVLTFLLLLFGVGGLVPALRLFLLD